MQKIMAVFVLASTVVAVSSRSIAETPADSATMDAVRAKLLRLP